MRRQLVLLAIIAVSFAATACADATAPRRDDPTPPCKSGYLSSTGDWICP